MLTVVVGVYVINTMQMTKIKYIRFSLQEYTQTKQTNKISLSI